MTPRDFLLWGHLKSRVYETFLIGQRDWRDIMVRHNLKYYDQKINVNNENKTLPEVFIKQWRIIIIIIVITKLFMFFCSNKIMIFIHYPWYFFCLFRLISLISSLALVHSLITDNLAHSKKKFTLISGFLLIKIMNEFGRDMNHENLIIWQ